MKKLWKRLFDYLHGAQDSNLFSLEGAVPLSKAIPFGFQHVLSMFVANVAPLLIIFSMIGSSATPEIIENGIRSAIFIAALGTTIQLFPIWRIGSRLPIVVGLSFTFVGVLGLVGSTYGIGTMFISIIIGGLFIGILGIFAKYWSHLIRPIVSACVVLGIGLSLLIVGVQEFFQYGTETLSVTSTGTTYYDFVKAWPYLIVSMSALLTCILFYIFVPGVWKNINILAGLVVGYLVALCFPGMIDFSGIHFNTLTDFINVPRPIFTLLSFSWGDFNVGAIVTVCLIYLVASTEGIGDISSLVAAGLGRNPTDKEIAGGLACDGFTSALSGCFGALPLTTFTQNVGIVGQTKIVNRFTIFQGVLFLFLASFFPIISRALMTIPAAALGGCMIMLFSSIVVIGMQMLSKCGWNQKNLIIASLSLGLGYGITLIPAFTAGKYGIEFVDYLFLIIQNPVANMFVISLILSYVLPDSMNGPKGKEPVEVASEKAENSSQNKAKA